MDAGERLKGAEALMTALYESLTTDGYSLGRVCYRFCELTGLDMMVHPVRSTLHYAGGLTVNNYLTGGMMDVNGQNLGGAERRTDDGLRAEVRRLESQLHDVSVECKKAINALRHGESDDQIDSHLARALRVIEGGAT